MEQSILEIAGRFRKRQLQKHWHVLQTLPGQLPTQMKAVEAQVPGPSQLVPSPSPGQPAREGEVEGSHSETT